MGIIQIHPVVVQFVMRPFESGRVLALGIVEIGIRRIVLVPDSQPVGIVIQNPVSGTGYDIQVVSDCQIGISPFFRIGTTRSETICRKRSECRFYLYRNRPFAIRNLLFRRIRRDNRRHHIDFGRVVYDRRKVFLHDHLSSQRILLRRHRTGNPQCDRQNIISNVHITLSYIRLISIISLRSAKLYRRRCPDSCFAGSANIVLP